MMHKSILFSELLWILISLIVVALIALPIYTHGIDYAFWTLLVASYLIAIFFLRLIFLLPYTLIEGNIWIQALLIFLCLPLFFIVFNGLHSFQSYLDFGELNDSLDHFNLQTRKYLYGYIRKVTVFGSVGAIMTILVLPIRLLISIWKLLKKRGYKGGTL